MSQNQFFLQAQIYHSRSETAANSFKYPVLNIYFDVSEMKSLREVLKKKFFHFIKIKPQDYLSKKHNNLEAEIIEFIKAHFSYQATTVYLQTIPKMFGYVFNPVSFWYFKNNNILEAVLCEVSNTFGEKHYYWLYKNGEDLNNQWLEAKKQFHVSPFFDIDGYYRFKFSLDDKKIDAAIHLHNSDNSLRLVTWIKGHLVGIDELSFFKIVLKYGWMTPLVVLKIHYQAVKLYFKNVTFYRKPKPPESLITKG